MYAMTVTLVMVCDAVISMNVPLVPITVMPTLLVLTTAVLIPVFVTMVTLVMVSAVLILMNAYPIPTIDATSMPVVETLMDHTLVRATTVTAEMVLHVLMSTNVPTVTMTVT